MECYEGATMIKTFRGLIADDTQDTIVLHTNDGSTGYRIVNFHIMGPDPNESLESCVKIYKIKQTALTATVDFSDNTLLAAGIMAGTTDRNIQEEVIIFDREIFNQDIYVTSKGESFTANMNYYIELEQVKLDLSENTVATLKDIRNLDQTI